MPSKSDIIIRNAKIIPVNIDEVLNADILISDGVIKEINRNISSQDAEVIDANGGLLLPGFVDTHRHTWQTQLRSTAGDWTLYDYLCKMRMIYSSYYSSDDVYLGNRIGMIEALNSGITTIVDHCHILNSPEHTDSAIKGLQDAGGRAIFCPGIFSNPSSHAPLKISSDNTWRYDDIKRVRKEVITSNDGLVSLGMAPSEPEVAPFDVFLNDCLFAQKIEAQVISCHVAMGAYNQDHQIVKKLYEEKTLTPEFLFVHGSSLTDEEIRYIADTGSAVSVTPETELQMGMGYPVAFRVSSTGAIASLGIDTVSNYSGDMFRQMRMMIQSARAQHNAALESQGKAPRKISHKAFDVLRLATLGGAEAVGLADKIGSIEVGKRADLIIIRPDTINMCPVVDPIASCVFNASASDVDLVMVNGNIVKRDGKMTNIDWSYLSTALKESSNKITAKADLVDRKVVDSIVDTFFENLV